MKKILTLAAVLGTASASFGQGYVAFANSPTTRISNNGVLQTASAVGSYYYALLVAPSTQNTISSANGSFTGWTFVTMGTNIASAGRLSGNNADANQAVAVAGLTGTSTADFAVVGWSANIGTDWAAVAAGFHGYGNNGTWAGASGTVMFGVSTVADDILLAPFQASYNNVFGTGANQIHGLNLQTVPVPEPTTFALVGLGAAALVIFRRRKA